MSVNFNLWSWIFDVIIILYLVYMAWLITQNRKDIERMERDKLDTFP